MANQEFYSPIKQDTDVIKQSTTDIDSATQRIETSVNEIKNTDLSSVNQNVLNNGLKIENISVVENKIPEFGGLGLNYGNAKTEAVSILGSGVLLAVGSTSNKDNYLKIVVDGITLVDAWVLDVYTHYSVFRIPFANSLRIDTWPSPSNIQIHYVLD